MKLASSWLDRLGLSTTAARLAMARARKALQLLMSGTLPSAMRDQVCVYHGVPRAGGPAAASTLRANRLDDLLHYDETGGRQTYQAFQYEAMKRLESRQEVYTVVDGGRLAFCAWVGGRGEVPAPACKETMPAGPDRTISLYDFYRHADASHETGLRGFLEQVLADLHGRFDAAPVQLVLRVHDKFARSVAEQAGFRLLTQP